MEKEITMIFTDWDQIVLNFFREDTHSYFINF
jgi:hypothetical protein